jgi:DivIVA protein
MTEHDRPGATADRPPKHKQASSKLADLGDRLARTFAPVERVERTPRPAEPWDVATEAHFAVSDGAEAPWDEDESTFPIVRHGYDRDAVDHYLNELEQEIDDLRIQRKSEPTVSDEIKKIGEQTAAILQTAHQQAAETTRKAREEAEKCLSDAAANALAMNDDAKAKLRTLDSETDSVWRERSRLIDDVRSVATALFSLAEEATDRFPAEADKRSRGATAGGPAPTPAASAPAPQPSAPAAQPSSPPQQPSSQAQQPRVQHPAAPPRVPPAPVSARPQSAATRPTTPAGRSVVGGDDHVGRLDNRADAGPFRQA